MRLLILVLLFALASNSIAKVPTVEYLIPTKALIFLPEVIEQQRRLMPNHPIPAYFGSLIEHESCIRLLHHRCWDPTSRLKSPREEGAGLGQITRAYRKDGSIRFDTIQNLRKMYMDELRELTWDNVYTKPELQIVAILLLYRESYNKLERMGITGKALLAMTDAAYNGGISGVHSDRRICGLKRNCDPKLWFNNTETTCSKSKRILYANRSACDINRHHVTDVLKVRLGKYISYHTLYHESEEILDEVNKYNIIWNNEFRSTYVDHIMGGQ